jgi:hypothetical protein
MAIEFELGIYKGFDFAFKNCVLPMFISPMIKIYFLELIIQPGLKIYSCRNSKEVFIFYDKDFTNNVGYIVKKAID